MSPRERPGVVVRLLMRDGPAAESIEAQVRRALCGVDPIEVWTEFVPYDVLPESLVGFGTWLLIADDSIHDAVWPLVELDYVRGREGLPTDWETRIPEPLKAFAYVPVPTRGAAAGALDDVPRIPDEASLLAWLAALQAPRR